MPYIYLLHCRAAINANENVYKIGKSMDFNKRLSGYDKGTIPIFTIYVSNCDDIEKILIKIFETRFILRKDYGNEYFQGEINEMIKTIMKEYEKATLSYCVEKTEDKLVVINNVNETNTTALIKAKKMLTNKLNKINIKNIYNFQRDINLSADEYNSSFHFNTLQNVGQFVYDTQHQGNKQKYGDYLESKNAFINNICYAAYYGKDNAALKLIERIKLCS
jgi:hypothetical protein